MQHEKFIEEYAAALATQDWEVVAPLIHTNACVTFSDGSVYKGLQSIAEAYKRNFSLIKNEKYSISEVHWINVSNEVAVSTFRFEWSGIINGQHTAGFGRGTSVIIFEDGKWKLLAEHLGPARS